MWSLLKSWFLKFSLTGFIVYLKKFLPVDLPVHVSMAALQPPTRQGKLYLCDQTKYKSRMENIIRRNTNQCTDLNISDCTLELAGYQLPIADAIRKMKNLTTLLLVNIDLRSSTFLEIESKELKKLYLCWCKTPLPIASLFKNDLCYKDSLVELHLFGNQWSEVPNDIFQFRNLLILSLSRNCITELPDKFTKLPKLQTLFLCRNQLRRVPPSIFQMQNLLKISLFNNRITELPNITSNSSKLQELDVSFNQLTHLPPSIFALQNLLKLSLNNNLITELPDMFDNLSKLKELSLSSNQLRHVPPSIFLLQNLSELDLSGNVITELPDIIHLPNLETLEFSRNQLTHVPLSIFEMHNLSELDLVYCVHTLSGDNFITELPDIINLPKLQYLSLSFNRLTNLPPSICSLHLKKLDVDYNEFNFEMTPSVGSELIVHSLKELTYRTILNHKVKVEEGMLPKRFLKDLDNHHQCICGRKYVDEGQELLFFCDLYVSSFTTAYISYNLRVPIRGKMCNSLKSCFYDRF